MEEIEHKHFYYYNLHYFKYNLAENQLLTINENNQIRAPSFPRFYFSNRPRKTGKRNTFQALLKIERCDKIA